MASNARDEGTARATASIEAKLAAIRGARKRIRELYEDEVLPEKFAKRRLRDLDWLELQLDAEMDALAETGPISTVLGDEQIQQLSGAVQRLRNHNVGADSARSIIGEIFTLIGIVT